MNTNWNIISWIKSIKYFRFKYISSNIVKESYLLVDLVYLSFINFW